MRTITSRAPSAMGITSRRCRAFMTSILGLATVNTSIAPDQPRHLLGWLHPREDTAVDPDAVLSFLRERGVIAAIDAEPREEGESVELAIAVDGQERVMVVRDGQVTTGRLLDLVATELAAQLDVALTIGEHLFSPDPDESADSADSADSGAASDEAAESDDDTCGDDCGCAEAEAPATDGSGTHPDALMARIPRSFMPQVVHDLGSGASASFVDGWTVALFDTDAVDATEHAWLGNETPVAQLSRQGETRWIGLLTGWQLTGGPLLTRLTDMVGTFTATDVAHPLVTAVTNPHLATDSELSALLEAKQFAHLAAADVASALQTPMDENWSSRVLAALGLPTLVADVHEGRTELPDPVRYDVEGPLKALGQMLKGYEDATDEEIAARSWFGRYYGAVRNRPALAAATVAGKAALAGYLLTRQPRWARGLGWYFASDAAMDAVLTARKVTQKR